MRIQDHKLLMDLAARVAQLEAEVEALKAKKPRGRPRKVQPDA